MFNKLKRKQNQDTFKSLVQPQDVTNMDNTQMTSEIVTVV